MLGSLHIVAHNITLHDKFKSTFRTKNHVIIFESNVIIVANITKG